MGPERQRQAVAGRSESEAAGGIYAAAQGTDRSSRSASPDPYAPAAGFADGWPVGYSPKAGWATLAHCYGSVGVGRDLAPDTGTGGELYAVIGHGPRQLDRNIALVGRVVEGIDRFSTLPRGTERARILQGQGAVCADRKHPAGERHAGGRTSGLSK